MSTEEIKNHRLCAVHGALKVTNFIEKLSFEFTNNVMSPAPEAYDNFNFPTEKFNIPANVHVSLVQLWLHKNNDTGATMLARMTFKKAKGKAIIDLKSKSP
jgi:hypothetical protein